jgi:hypothetical protein
MDFSGDQVGFVGIGVLNRLAAAHGLLYQVADVANQNRLVLAGALAPGGRLGAN